MRKNGITFDDVWEKELEDKGRREKEKVNSIQTHVLRKK
jgi:hypothetical protein